MILVVEIMADDKDVEKTIAEDLVVTKYKMAGEIVNSELKCLKILTLINLNHNILLSSLALY